MNRLLPTLCTVALLGVAALAYLRFESEKGRHALQAQLNDEIARTQHVAAELGMAKEESTALGTKVRSLESEVAAAKSKLTAAESRAAQFETTLAQARTTLAVHEQNARALATELATVRQELGETRASNASPDAV